MEQLIVFTVVLVVGLAGPTGRGAMRFVALFEFRAGRSGRHGRMLDTLVPGSRVSSIISQCPRL